MIRQPNLCVKSGIDPVPSHMLYLYSRAQLTADIMFLNKIPFFVTISINIKFGAVEVLPNQQVPTVVENLQLHYFYTDTMDFKLK